MKQRVIVIGHGYGIRLGVIRAVAALGCDVTVIHIGPPVKPIDCYSKYVKDVLYFNRKEGEQGLVRLLLDRCTVTGQKPVIIPTSDFSAIAIDNEEIKKHFSVPHINNTVGSSIGFWMDKSRQKELALSVGLNTARSVIAEKRGDVFFIPDGIKYPCFTKPVASIGAGKKCQGRCDTPEDLKAVLAVAERNGISQVLVEDFIDIHHEYAVLGYSNGKDVVIPGIIKFIKGSKMHKGVAMAGEVMPVTGFDELIDKFTIFVREMGFVGIFDIDFLECDGVFYFDEMNLRTGGSGTAIWNSGVNLPAMFVKAMCGEPTDSMERTLIRPAVFVNDKLALDDFAAGGMSLRKYRKWIGSADILFIKDENDPAPYREFKKLERKQIYNYKRMLKRLLHND